MLVFLLMICLSVVNTQDSVQSLVFIPRWAAVRGGEWSIRVREKAKL